MPEAANDRATLLITVPSATVAFTLAFNFGAFDEIFFDVILTVWVVATTVLVGSIATRRLPPQYWGGRIVLILPSLWLLVAYIDEPGDDVIDGIVFPAAIAVTLICLPFITWALLSAINPDFVSLPTRNKVIVGVAVIAFGLSGFFMGERNDLFFYCEDFKVSGNDLPSDCVEDKTVGSGAQGIEWTMNESHVSR